MVKQRVFVPTSREGWKHSFAEGGNVPPLRWQLGCIQEVILGGDGVIRVAMVRTATGLIKRAVANLAVLPIDSEIVGTLPLPKGGVCSEQIASA